MTKILIINARFYNEISDLLLQGAINEINKYGQLSYDIVDVVGALEIPGIISIANVNKRYDGYVALGCVIRGETSHYDIVANQSAEGLMKLTIDYRLAIGNGILTVENEEQAITRADPMQKNKGGFAVEACLKVIELKRKFNS